MVLWYGRFDGHGSLSIQLPIYRYHLISSSPPHTVRSFDRLSVHPFGSILIGYLFICLSFSSCHHSHREREKARVGGESVRGSWSWSWSWSTQRGAEAGKKGNKNKMVWLVCLSLYNYNVFVQFPSIFPSSPLWRAPKCRNMVGNILHLFLSV